MDKDIGYPGHEWKEREMARIHVLSDLHCEFGPFDPPQVDADVTVLAGDTFTKRRCCPWEDAATTFGRPVVMVPGNHEFYADRVDTGVARLREAAARKNVTVLDNSEAVVAGVRFLGSTLWSDFRLFAGDNMDRVRADASWCVGSRHSGGMNDFRNIRVEAGKFRKFQPLDAAMLCRAAVVWLRERMAEPFDGPTVVVTHHAPSALCVPDSLLSDPMTCAYASKLDWLVEEGQPDMWIWGHIHASVPEFSIGRTRMVSNPRGYVPADVNPSFRPDLVVEVGPTPVPQLNR